MQAIEQKRMCLIILLLWGLGLSVSGAAGQEPIPATMYRELFGTRERQVVDSREAEDNIAFANELIKSADDLTDAPQLQALMYYKAFEVAVIEDAGFSAAGRALAQLDGMAPALVREYDPKVLDAFVDRYRRSGYLFRREVLAPAYLVRLVAAADRLMGAGQSEKAVALMEDAVRVAIVARNTEVRDALRQRIRMAESRVKVEREIRDLKEKILAGKQVKVSATRLTELYLLEINDPAQAAKYAGFSEDAQLQQAIQWLGKPMAELQAEQLVQLGQWYQSLADRADSDHGKAIALTRALHAYQGLLQHHDKQDLLKLKAKVAKGRLESALKDLPTVNTGSLVTVVGVQASSVLGKQVNLLKWVDVELPHRGHPWRMAGGQLITPGKPGSAVRIPVVPDGDYQVDIQARLTDRQQPQVLFMLLPIGDASVYAGFDGAGGKREVLGEVDGKRLTLRSDRPSIFADGQYHQLTWKVAGQSGQCQIQMLVDQRPVAQWSGKVAQLSPWAWIGSVDGQLAIGSWTGYEIRRADLTMLNGTARQWCPALPKGVQVALTDLTPSRANPGWGEVGRGGHMGWGRGRVSVRGQAERNVVSVHAGNHGTPGWVAYQLQGQFRSMKGVAAFQDSARDQLMTPVTFRILGDGKVLWESKPMSKKTDAQQFKVNLTGVNQLRLETIARGRYSGAHSIWYQVELSR